MAVAEDLVGKIANENGVPLGHDERALNHVLQFTNVAWPMVGFQCGQRLAAD